MLKKNIDNFRILKTRLYCQHSNKTHPNKRAGKWISVIGLEVHAQISSKSKLFSGSSTSFSNPLNSAVSLFDASIPGTLPVLNRKCVEAGVKTALALKCRINPVSMFDRKHYFYADLPAGYQITQQRSALANNGVMRFPVIIPGKSQIYEKTVRLHQLQLEQDSGKSLHDEHLKRSLVDLNRAGVPLMELVFDPDLETGEEAASLVKELILILQSIGTCSCRMEEGALRVDANVSIHQSGQPYGVRTEIKNIGSVRNISHAISYEIGRQIDIKNNGGEIHNETRSWDSERRQTVSMRDKEVLQDYRFMPEPNLPPLRVDVEGQHNRSDSISIPNLMSQIPHLPETVRQNLIEQYSLKRESAIILVNEPDILEYFLSIIKGKHGIPSQAVANFLINDFLSFVNKSNIDVEKCKVTIAHFEDILKSLFNNEISLTSARTLIEELHDNPEQTVAGVIKANNLHQINDSIEIEKLCLSAIEKNPKAVKSFKAGKQKALFAIAGEVAKQSDQRANMGIVVKRLEELLKAM